MARTIKLDTQHDKPRAASYGKDTTFKEVVDISKAHYDLKPLVIAERFRFSRCSQKQGETVTQSAAALKQYVVNATWERVTNSGSFRQRDTEGETCVCQGWMDNSVSASSAVTLFHQKNEQQSVSNCVCRSKVYFSLYALPPSNFIILICIVLCLGFFGVYCGFNTEVFF